jgi:hypothetical protein
MEADPIARHFVDLARRTAMTDPDPHPDSPPEADHDHRSDIEQAVSGTNRNIEQLEEAEDTVSSTSPEGAQGENGAGGVVKNQDDLAQ